MNKYYFQHSKLNSVRRITICGFKPEQSDSIYLGISVCHPKYDIFDKITGRKVSKKRAKRAFINRNDTEVLGQLNFMGFCENDKFLLTPIIVKADEVPGAVFAKVAGNIIEDSLKHFLKVDSDTVERMKTKLECKIYKLNKDLKVLKQLSINSKTVVL